MAKQEQEQKQDGQTMTRDDHVGREETRKFSIINTQTNGFKPKDEGQRETTGTMIGSEKCIIINNTHNSGTTTNRAQHSGSDYLVVLKVHGNAIQLGPQDEMQDLAKTHTFKIFCHDLNKVASGSTITKKEEEVNIKPAGGSSNIKVFVLNLEQQDNISQQTSECQFLPQQAPFGQPIQQTDLVTFMTEPIESMSTKASYGIELSLSKNATSIRESLNNNSMDVDRKLGTAYLYLDPKFSTQGVQRMQVIGSYNQVPIGQIQIEYLIVKKPQAYEIRVPRPLWLSNVIQLDAGHRGSGSGCRADLPGSITENTIASFNYAYNHGADMVELDVMCTADGIPVVYHNYTLDVGSPDATQIDQLTLEELRSLKGFKGLHDKDCKFKNNENEDHQQKMVANDIDDNQKSDSNCNQKERKQQQNLLFPTLEQVLTEVDQHCALNIELKWPQMLPNGKSEATHNREINDYVDKVLNCIDEHSNGRQILLSTLNSDVAIILRLKQSKYLVLFLTTGDSSRFNDPITKTVRTAIHFAQAFDLAGINPNAAMLTEELVRYAQDRGQLVYAWGKIESAKAIQELKRTGLNGVIYDKIDLIKPQD